VDVTIPRQHHKSDPSTDLNDRGSQGRACSPDLVVPNGVRSSSADAGSIDGGQRALPAMMGPVKGYRVTRVCGSSVTTVSELGIQVSRGHGYGQVDGLRVTYHVGKGGPDHPAQSATDARLHADQRDAEPFINLRPTAGLLRGAIW